MTRIDPTKLEAAREMAEAVNRFPKAYDDQVRAAAEVIAALPNIIIDGEEIITIYDRWRDEAITLHETFRDVIALLPAPQPRTLADITREEREACQWMQAHDNRGRLCVIERITSTARVLYEDGYSGEFQLYKVTPLPDLPRMVWPGEQATEEDMSIIPPEIDTSTGHDDRVDMTPQDAPDGYYLVLWWGEEHPVPAEKVQGQWWVIGKPTMLPAKDVLIVSRLIPEVKV